MCLFLYVMGCTEQRPEGKSEAIIFLSSYGVIGLKKRI